MGYKISYIQLLFSDDDQSGGAESEVYRVKLYCSNFWESSVL